MKPPTAKEIAAEIAKLREMKPTVLRASMFGDNHHDAIDAQVEVLEQRMSEDEVFDKYPFGDEGEGEDDVAENVHNAARDAALWLAGESDDGNPSKNWESLVRK